MHPNLMARVHYQLALFGKGFDGMPGDEPRGGNIVTIE